MKKFMFKEINRRNFIKNTIKTSRRNSRKINIKNLKRSNHRKKTSVRIPEDVPEKILIGSSVISFRDPSDILLLVL